MLMKLTPGEEDNYVTTDTSFYCFEGGGEWRMPGIEVEH